MDGGCKNFASENSEASPFFTSNNNEHVIKMHDFDWFRKLD